MRAVVVGRFGGPEVLTAEERPEPVPADREILVRVRAANVNPTDLAARQGFMVGRTIDPPFVLGWDFAGEVASVGSGAIGWTPGDRVVGMIPWYVVGGRVGTYAELVSVDSDWIVPIPGGLDDHLAATIPLNALTARQALDLLAPEPGSRILITGASGSVGGFAAQMAVADGLEVTAVAGRDDEEWVRSLGVFAVLPRDSDLATHGRFPNVLDAVPLGEPVLRAVSDGGSVVATRPTPAADPARGLRQDVVLIRADQVRLGALVADVASGRLKTRVDRTLPLEDAGEAHRLVEAGGLHGKVVLAP